MNLIKFKDIVKVGDDVFNTYLKGKYAYWIQMRYIVPFDFISEEDYIKAETDIDYIKNRPNQGINKTYWDSYKDEKILAYVDEQGTEEANDISSYLRYNKFAADSDITLEEIKKFRTWLAATLLEFDQDKRGNQKNQFYSADFTHVLQYYACGMYNDVVKAMITFGKPDFSIKTLDANCNCGNHNLSSTYDGLINACDPLGVYRKNIYDAMCLKFGDPDFWMEMSKVFLCEFKEYIDNILQCNLLLGKSKYVSLFTDCPCQSNQENENGREILTRLSKSLEILIDDDLKGHRNYVLRAFQDWSQQLYEIMEW